MGSTGAGLLSRTTINYPHRPFFLPHSPSKLGSHLFRRRRWYHSLPCIRDSKGTGLGSISKEKPVEERKKPQRRNQRELWRTEEEEEENMTIKPVVRISADGKVLVNGRTVLTGVPANVNSTAATGPGGGAFVGADFRDCRSRHVVSLGTLRDLRFMACFRFNLWWMAQKMGNRGRDVPLETQFLLLELGGGSGEEMAYTAVLPLVEGPFRSCIQGNSDDALELCVESGDAKTSASAFSHLLFIGSANSDPFAAISDGVRAVKHHLNSFRQRAEKRLPPILDYFGWCTWDAFYQDVTQEGVESGIDTLMSGGAPPKFVIIDDGWQSVGLDEHDGSDADEKPTLMRLTGIKENPKFQTKTGIAPEGIKNIVGVAKEKYGLKYVYVWHAITGYWGGVKPGVAAMEDYNSAMQYPKISPTMMQNEPGLKTDVLTVQGLGLVDPKKVFQFYDELHAYLASAGVDGVKVDVQCVLETLGADLGGRVQLTRQYHQALDASVAKNFPGNNIIACMSHNTDALYCSKQTAVVRASDDFYPRDPISHTIHIASVAYNSVFLGEFMVPDWDMFHSLHPAADYHASARAISGGPVYVSDAPGKHNFELLRKLVLPDGSILRARLPGRPTRDCLFTDPARDSVSLLKIWNMNKYTGVLGVFNCQGAAWSTVEKKNMFHETGSNALTCSVKGNDVHLISEAATGPDWNGDTVFYRHEDGDLMVLPCNSTMSVSLKVLEHGIFTVSPVKVLAQGLNFAPLGLVQMYNAGGAIEGLTYDVNGAGDGFTGKTNGTFLKALDNMTSTASVLMEVKGCGKFGAYSSTKPRKCSVDSVGIEFCYDSSSGLVTLNLEHLPKGERKFHLVVIEL